MTSSGPSSTGGEARGWLLPGLLGTGVLVAGLAEAATTSVVEGDSRLPLVVLVVALATSVAVSRHLPALAMLIAWAAGALQLATAAPILVTELSISVVAFGVARWGHAVTVWLSGLSIPAAAVVAVAYVGRHGLETAYRLLGNGPALKAAVRYQSAAYLIIGGVAFAVLALPWLAGLALRFNARARASSASREVAQADAARAQRETEQAREIARLREEQARLSRDVHDVVGHSLAVILAQAESAQFLPDQDPAALKRTMATIATSARASLQDVRQVLAGTSAQTPARSDAFEGLLAGVRAGGHDVVASELGTPQPLPPELDVVAHRVVQEMLTNAIKHGRRDRPVVVERHWPQMGDGLGNWDRDLRIEVRNVADHASDETQPLRAADEPPGQGLEGMRRRLDSVGGRLDVRRRDEPDGPTFTATAWVPVRAVSR